MLFVVDAGVALRKEDILVTTISLMEWEIKLYLCFVVSQV